MFSICSSRSTVIGSGGCLHLLLLFHHDERIHAILLNIHLIVPLQLCYIGMLFRARNFAGNWVVKVADVVFFGLQFLELPLDLRQIHIYLFLITLV